MTTKKPAPKKVAAPRRQRITAAEIRRRELTQNARDDIAMMDTPELAGEVQKIAIKQPGILEYEILMAAAQRLDHQYAIEPVPVTLPSDPAKFLINTGGQSGVLGDLPQVFNSPTADSTSGEDGAA